MKYILIVLFFYLIKSFEIKRLNKYELVKTMINQSKGYGTLSTLSSYKKIKDYPQNSVVAYSCTKEGKPIFCFSSISQHSRNIKLNNRVSFSLTEKNFLNAADVRATFVGNIKKVDDKDYTLLLKELFMSSHPHAFWANFPDFSLYILDEIKDISINGGFGKADKLVCETYYKSNPDYITLKTNDLLPEIEKNYLNVFKKYLKLLNLNNDATLKNINKFGINLRISEVKKTSLFQIPFSEDVLTLDDLSKQLDDLAKEVRH